MTTPDTLELRRLAEAATAGPWTNVDDLRGEKRSVWVADTAREETEADGVTPSRYGPSRTTICNVLASNYGLPEGGYDTLDPFPNAAFIAAANPAVILALLDRLEAAEGLLKESADLTGLCTTPERFGECGSGEVFLRMTAHNAKVRAFLAPLPPAPETGG